MPFQLGDLVAQICFDPLDSSSKPLLVFSSLRERITELLVEVTKRLLLVLHACNPRNDPLANEFCFWHSSDALVRDYKVSVQVLERFM